MYKCIFHLNIVFLTNCTYKYIKRIFGETHIFFRVFIKILRKCFYRNHFHIQTANVEEYKYSFHYIFVPKGNNNIHLNFLTILILFAGSNKDRTSPLLYVLSHCSFSPWKIALYSKRNVNKIMCFSC